MISLRIMYARLIYFEWLLRMEPIGIFWPQADGTEILFRARTSNFPLDAYSLVPVVSPFVFCKFSLHVHGARIFDCYSSSHARPPTMQALLNNWWVRFQWGALLSWIPLPRNIYIYIFNFLWSGLVRRRLHQWNGRGCCNSIFGPRLGDHSMVLRNLTYHR